jgi:hypothetical protein
MLIPAGRQFLKFISSMFAAGSFDAGLQSIDNLEISHMSGLKNIIARLGANNRCKISGSVKRRRTKGSKYPVLPARAQLLCDPALGRQVSIPVKGIKSIPVSVAYEPVREPRKFGSVGPLVPVLFKINILGNAGQNLALRCSNKSPG